MNPNDAQQPQKRALLIDDEPQISRVLSPILLLEQYDLRTAENAAQGIEIITAWKPNIVLLDLGLPDMDGKDVIRRLRDWSEVPIIVLSARTLETEKVAALDLGANDYIDKPFSSGELLARMRAALRNAHRRHHSDATWTSRHVTVDFARRLVTTHGIPQHLTPKEYDLLRILTQHADQAMTHQQLIRLIWKENDVRDAQTLRVLVSQLRQKIEDDPANPTLILTESGFGYRLASDFVGNSDLFPKNESV